MIREEFAMSDKATIKIPRNLYEKLKEVIEENMLLKTFNPVINPGNY